MYAITPTGIGKKPSARAIHRPGELVIGETFIVFDYSPEFVLAEDETSLRPRTQIELDAEILVGEARQSEQAEQTVLIANAVTDSVFTALTHATPTQIAEFIASHFSSFDAQQQAVMKIVLQTAILTIK